MSPDLGNVGFSEEVEKKELAFSLFLTSSKSFEKYCIANIQSARFSLQQDVFSMNSWSNWTSNESFEICWSWEFRNTPYMFHLMKFWIWWRIDWDIQCCRIYLYSLTSIISVKTSSNQTCRGCLGILMTSRFQNCHWKSNLTKNSWRKQRKCLVANWTAQTVYSHLLTQFYTIY